MNLHVHSALVAAPTKKVKRTNISKIGATFIDGFVQSYITLKGNATGRKNLVKRILAEAGTRKAELEAEDWTFQVVSTRLKNAASKLSKNHWSATA